MRTLEDEKTDPNGLRDFAKHRIGEDEVPTVDVTFGGINAPLEGTKLVTNMWKNTSLMVLHWLTTRKVTLRYKSEAFYIDGEIVPNKSILNYILITCQNSGIHGTKDKISPALDTWRERVQAEYVSSVRAEVCRKVGLLSEGHTEREDGNFILERFVRLMTGYDSDLDVAVLKHFIWQVKRKLNKMPVKWHMMPVFVGDQGCGKTTFIQMVLEPLRDLWIRKDLKIFKDKREWPGFQKYFVFFFDEMAEAKKVDSENIKQFMSEGEISHRPLHTNSMEALANNSTFIGASNKSVSDLIQDTEMRRFWEIKCLPTRELTQNWAELKAMDYRLIWDAVDENDDPPVEKHMAAIKGTQTVLAKSGTIGTFVDHKINIAGKTPHSADECWALFEAWCKELRMERPPLTKNTFLKQFKTFVHKSQATGCMSYHFSVKTGLEDDEP